MYRHRYIVRMWGLQGLLSSEVSLTRQTIEAFHYSIVVRKYVFDALRYSIIAPCYATEPPHYYTVVPN